jgi:hypothetical protein
MLLIEVKITSEMIPQGWSLECADFINKVYKINNIVAIKAKSL